MLGALLLFSTCRRSLAILSAVVIRDYRVVWCLGPVIREGVGHGEAASRRRPRWLILP